METLQIIVHLILIALYCKVKIVGVLAFAPYHFSANSISKPTSSVSSHVLDSNNNGEQTQLTSKSLQKLLKNLLEEGSSIESLLCSRMPITSDCTRIDESKVKNAGRGLFASKDVKKGDILTCYPGDVLVVASEKNPEMATFVWGTHVSENLRLDDNDLMTDMSGYILQVSEEHAIVGLPFLDEERAYAGHFANDGACPPRRESDIATYVLESNDLSNAMHQSLTGCHMVTVATRDIQEGEEILVTYGPEYWMEHFAEYSDDDYQIQSTQVGNGKGFG